MGEWKFVRGVWVKWPWPIVQQGQIWSLMLLYREKLLESHLMEEIYLQQIMLK